MWSQRTSPATRVVCVLLAVFCGLVAVKIAATGEMRVKNGPPVVLSPLARCLPVGALGTLCVVAGWVAVTGRD